jgi:hypothetical protein
MSIGSDTFDLNKKEFTEKLSRIIANFRAGSRLIGEPRDFTLRACRLTEQWQKMANDPDVMVYLRQVDIAGGRKVKMIVLERGATKQPVGKAKLCDALYPPKKIATSATVEEKHFNATKAAMRNAVSSQLKGFRDLQALPVQCYLTGKHIRKGTKADVDHVGSPFAELCDGFLASKQLRYTDVALQGPPTAKRFRDDVLWAEWQQFHRDRARFALVCASANRSKGADGYTTPEELLGSFAAESPEDMSLDF